MKYTAKAKLKYVLVKDKDKSTGSKTIYKIYDAKDTYSGVHYAEGGLTDAEYVSKRNSIVVDTSGKVIEDKKNGVWLKESANPVGSIDENNALKLKSAADWENYLKGGSADAEVELSPNRISKSFYGWKGKTETKSQINGYDWEIVTMKRSNGKLVSDIQGGKIIKGDGYSSFGYTPTDDPSATLIVTTPKVVNEKRVREQHEQAVAEFKKMVAEGRLPKKKYSKGGSTDAEWKKRQKMFGFKPYGSTKGRYMLQYMDEGQPQQEIIESKEMAIDTANRYKRLFSNVRVIEPDGTEIPFYAKGGEMANFNGAGIFADGGRLENISAVIKPKIEAIEKILPKALGEGGIMTIVFAFQTKDGYAFNMESKSDYPVNRATPKLKRIGVVVERTGEKGKRLITIPKSVFDQMTTIYMVGGEFADGGIQNHPLNIQIHTKIAEELGREMAARFIINDYSRDSGIGAVRLIEMAIQRGFISLNEINSDIINSAEEQADESAEMEEIGSSDTNILIHSMLRNAGIEMDYEGNRMVRKYSTPEEANIKSSTHKNEK